jgi:hypothetical protein
MDYPAFEQEYESIIAALQKSGVMTILPMSRLLGVTGIDGKEYPAPTCHQVSEILAHNNSFIEKKMQQGFTRLQITPIAAPASRLIDCITNSLIRHAAEGKLYQTRQGESSVDIPVQLNKKEAIWMWSRIRQILDTPNLVYFPREYNPYNHQGFTKEEATQNKLLCAVPGWSVGLIESGTIMPQPGQGKTLAGRKQLEGVLHPREFLQILNSIPYQGETGWVLEDFLAYFITQLETTNRVSHDRTDGNALWLLGTYVPDMERMPNLVLVGYWSRGVGRKLYLTSHRTGNRLKMCVARSMVRLSP